MKKTSVELSSKAAKDLKKIPRFIAVKLFKWKVSVGLVGLEETRKIPGFHDEPLKGHRTGQRSIRLNSAYRAIYIISSDTKEIRLIEIVEVNKHEY